MPSSNLALHGNSSDGNRALPNKFVDKVIFRKMDGVIGSQTQEILPCLPASTSIPFKICHK